MLISLPRELLFLLASYLDNKDLLSFAQASKRLYHLFTSLSFLQERTKESDELLCRKDHLRALNRLARCYFWKYTISSDKVVQVIEPSKIYFRHVLAYGKGDYVTDLFGRLYHRSYEYPCQQITDKRDLRKVIKSICSISDGKRDRLVTLDYDGNITIDNRVHHVNATRLVCKHFPHAVYGDNKNQYFTLSTQGVSKSLLSSNMWKEFDLDYSSEKSSYIVSCYLNQKDDLYTSRMGFMSENVKKFISINETTYCYITLDNRLLCHGQYNQPTYLMCHVRDAVSEAGYLYVLTKRTIYRSQQFYYDRFSVIMDDLPSSLRRINVTQMDPGSDVLIECW